MHEMLLKISKHCASNDLKIAYVNKAVRMKNVYMETQLKTFKNLLFCRKMQRKSLYCGENVKTMAKRN